jgi:hypothetical protein
MTSAPYCTNVTCPLRQYHTNVIRLLAPLHNITWPPAPTSHHMASRPHITPTSHGLPPPYHTNVTWPLRTVTWPPAPIIITPTSHGPFVLLHGLPPTHHTNITWPPAPISDQCHMAPYPHITPTSHGIPPPYHTNVTWPPAPISHQCHMPIPHQRHMPIPASRPHITLTSHGPSHD